MGRTKQTPQGSASHRPVGMITATFTSTGRGKTGPEGQFIDAQGEDTEENFLLVLEDAAKKPKEDIIKQVQLPSVKVEIRNSGRNGEDRRQDLQRVDIDVPPTKLQKAQPNCQRSS